MKFPEHALQTQVCAFVRETVCVPHLFLAFDRTRKMSDMQHIFEKQRGIKSGTPDTVLLIQDFPSIWCELKAGQNKPNDNQEKVGAEITKAGHLWFWANSISTYLVGLIDFNVPLHRDASLIAARRDRLLLADAIKTPIRRSTRKPRTAKPTLAQIRKAEVMRLLP